MTVIGNISKKYKAGTIGVNFTSSVLREIADFQVHIKDDSRHKTEPDTLKLEHLPEDTISELNNKLDCPANLAEAVAGLPYSISIGEDGRILLTDCRTDESFIEDVYSRLYYIFTELGLNYWDGGYFYMERNGAPLDGGAFKDSPVGIVDCGLFNESLQFSIDGGLF